MAGDCRKCVEDWNDVDDEAQFLVRKQRVDEHEADDRKGELARARVEVWRCRCEWNTEEQAARND